MSEDNDSSDNEFETMFRVVDEEDEFFSFESMAVKHIVESEEIEIIYSFCLNSETTFESKIYIQLAGLNEEICTSLLISDLSFLRIIFSMGMCILHWFWMGFGTPTIEIGLSVAEQIQLNNEILDYWQVVYEPMMAEFLYINRIPNKKIILQVSPQYTFQTYYAATNDRKWCEDAINLKKWAERFSVLVPLGGGKDSLVVWHLEKEAGENPLSVYVSDGLFEFTLNWRLSALVSAMNPEDNEKNVVLIRHIFIDENFKKFSRSYLEPCGHPWAAVVLFDSVLLSWLTGINRISLGFEKSADEGNGVFVSEGSLEVNHQYDKSCGFINRTQQYIARHIDRFIVCKSPLSHLWELEIARIFCETPSLQQFHSLFLSCNEPVNHSSWCGKCDKCAFICMLLSAWRGTKYVADTVFSGINLFENAQLENTFLRLVDATSMKPMDCVGTVQEARDAIALVLERESKPYPVVLQALENFIHSHPL